MGALTPCASTPSVIGSVWWFDGTYGTCYVHQYVILLIWIRLVIVWPQTECEHVIRCRVIGRPTKWCICGWNMSRSTAWAITSFISIVSEDSEIYGGVQRKEKCSDRTLLCDVCVNSLRGTLMANAFGLFTVMSWRKINRRFRMWYWQKDVGEIAELKRASSHFALI